MSKIILLIVVVAVAFMWFNKNKKNKQLAIENASAGSAFLAENAKDVDVATTDSGLQYKVLQQGTGDVHPKATDSVTVHYHLSRWQGF